MSNRLKELTSNRLTAYEIKCVLDVLHEKLAGGQDDLRDALGVSNSEAARMCSALERAVEKLSI
jgi:hypothetical protein